MLMVQWLCMIDCGHAPPTSKGIWGFLSLLFVLMNDLGAKFCLQYHQYKFSIFKGICFWNLR